MRWNSLLIALLSRRTAQLDLRLVSAFLTTRSICGQYLTTFVVVCEK
jgi:hypothetical protein